MKYGGYFLGQMESKDRCFPKEMSGPQSDSLLGYNIRALAGELIIHLT